MGCILRRGGGKRLSLIQMILLTHLKVKFKKKKLCLTGTSKWRCPVRCCTQPAGGCGRSSGDIILLLQIKSGLSVVRIITLSVIIMLAGCVSNKSVQTVQIGDEDKSCDQLKAELVQLGVTFDEVKDDSGLTGKNVGLAIVFWPGIIVNEVRSNNNEDSISDRISHLTTIYNGKCLGDADEKDDSLLKDKLLELKDLLEQGLITQDEYDVARAKVMAEIVAPQEEEQEEKPDAE